jgi:antitoxin PrlF
MAGSIVTSTGRVTIPMDVRSELGIKAGDAVELRLNAHTGQYILLRKIRSIQDLRGMFKHASPATTVDGMNQAIADHLGEEDERIQREWREPS